MLEPIFQKHAGYSVAYIISLSGSPAEFSRSGFLADRVGRELQRLGHAVDTLAIRELPAQALLQGDCSDAAIQLALSQIAAADALIVSTPVYKLAYSGLLKVFLDLLPQRGLVGKLILPVVTAGSALPLIAASEYALKPVLSSLGVTRQFSGVLATEADLPGGAGVYEPTEALLDRLLIAVRSLIEGLEPTRHARLPEQAAA